MRQIYSEQSSSLEQRLTGWRHQMEAFSALLDLCAGNSPVPVNSPQKGQSRRALTFSLVNNRDAGNLRRRRCDRTEIDFQSIDWSINKQQPLSQLIVQFLSPNHDDDLGHNDIRYDFTRYSIKLLLLGLNIQTGLYSSALTWLCTCNGLKLSGDALNFWKKYMPHEIKFHIHFTMVPT